MPAAPLGIRWDDLSAEAKPVFRRRVFSAAVMGIALPELLPVDGTFLLFLHKTRPVFTRRCPFSRFLRFYEET